MPTYRNDTGTSQVVPNLAGNNVVVGAGESIQTYRILGTGWTKTSDEPYFRLTTFRQVVTSPGSVTGLSGQRIIRVVTPSDGISMTANAAANPNAYPLTAYAAIDIANDGEIDALIFTGTGTVTVIGLPE